MRNFDMGVGMDEEPIHYTELEKAVDLIGLIVVEEDKLLEFMKALNGLEAKAHSGAISAEEIEALEKGKKDLSKLVKKKVTDKNGKTTTKWVKAGESPTKDAGKGDDLKDDARTNAIRKFISSKKITGNESMEDMKKLAKESGYNAGDIAYVIKIDKDKKPAGKNVEKHAEDTRTHKLEKYVKEGKDEKLKQIAKDELRKRKSEDSKKKYADAQGKGGSKQDELDRHAKSKKDSEEGKVVGKTKSGKFVFSHHEGGGHEGFTEQDHKDAHSMHTKETDDTRNSPKIRDHHRNQASIHAKEANKKMVAGMAEKKIKDSDFKHNQK